jgi:hypothetical protein
MKEMQRNKNEQKGGRQFKGDILLRKKQCKC